MFVRYLRYSVAGGVQAGRDARHQGRAQPCQQQAALPGRHRLEALNITRQKILRVITVIAFLMINACDVNKFQV
jgi:hypothetical protein